MLMSPFFTVAHPPSPCFLIHPPSPCILGGLR